MEKEELEYVGFWPRVGATLIDSILLIAVTSPFLLAIYGGREHRAILSEDDDRQRQQQ